MPDSLSAINHAFSIHQGGKGGSGATLLKKADASVEEQAKDMEKKVHEILEQSALLTHKEEHAMGAYIWAGIIGDIGDLGGLGGYEGLHCLHSDGSRVRC